MIFESREAMETMAAEGQMARRIQALEEIDLLKKTDPEKWKKRIADLWTQYREAIPGEPLEQRLRSVATR